MPPAGQWNILNRTPGTNKTIPAQPRIRSAFFIVLNYRFHPEVATMKMNRSALLKCLNIYIFT
jgi:hypothetical protein